MTEKQKSKEEVRRRLHSEATSTAICPMSVYELRQFVPSQKLSACFFLNTENRFSWGIPRRKRGSAGGAHKIRDGLRNNSRIGSLPTPQFNCDVMILPSQ